MNEIEFQKSMKKPDQVSGLEAVKKWYRGLPDKKRYLELITAFLSIPVLLTVLITNATNLRNLGQASPSDLAPTPDSQAASGTTIPGTATPGTTIIYVPQASESGNQTTQPTSQPECKKGIGSVSINYPEEHETVSNDPVCVDITRQSSEYCSIVWSYRINDGLWSDYLDKSICLYGLTPGEKKLQLKIRSVVSNEEQQLSRNFTVAGEISGPNTATGSGASL